MIDDVNATPAGGSPEKRTNLGLSAVLLALVPITYALGIALAGYPPLVSAVAVGALGWIIALALRTPVILLAIRLLETYERAMPVIISVSGPAEETVRVICLLLLGRDARTALWLGIGWASIEVVYAFINSVALARLATRTDPEAERARQMLPPLAFTSAEPWWGAIERAGASALHIGFTLIVAAVPIAFVLTAIAHSAFNLAITSLSRNRSAAVVEGVVCACGGFALVVGLFAIGIL